MKKNTINRMLVIIKRRHNTIKFTHEVEDNETLCFLDTQIKRVDKKLTFNIYRKPTATFRYIPIESHHSIEHKSAAFNSMIHRLVKEIKTIAKINVYSEEFVDRIHNKHKKKEELRNLTTLMPVLKRDDASTKKHTITFYPAIMNKLPRIFRNHQIDLVYSNKGTLKDHLGNPKNKTEMLQKSGAILCTLTRQNLA
jgi:IS1 family transposase